MDQYSRPTQHRFFSLVSAALFVPALLSACTENEPTVAQAVSRPVKTALVQAPDVGGIRRFPARIDALHKAELAFRVAGTVQKLAVKEGDRVKKGQILATLDPTDYKIAVKDAQASFDRAQKDFKRAKELVKKGFISRSDYDAKEAAWKNTRAALERANQDLAYTRLKASFAGTIAKRYVEPFEEVQAKQAIFAIHDRSRLEVKINVPETVILGIRASGGEGPEPGAIPVTASFDSRPGEEFDLTLREIATRADPATQTFAVTFTMPAPKDFLVLPGMTATVTADFSGVTDGAPLLFVPAAAVTADSDLEPFVWVVDEANMQVMKNPVEVGRMHGSSIEIKAGLEVGKRVVVAGVGYLAAGMQVRLLSEHEEAEPRSDEGPGS
ncbi:efflux RND transporter periplasmic adaptor subunit [Candidatus Thiosymbion oneisti]|uniref:efflux RND transporter periplasmic adaptor subunit n=1 Tax=Candidatus Thiosymbion oneisti TaxID=589554 RepID=UPI001FB69813|nr:efflux RND transporter periplasmic adaptor subunit [Candidatus Thiosymbion oneisti]